MISLDYQGKKASSCSDYDSDSDPGISPGTSSSLSVISGSSSLSFSRMVSYSTRLRSILNDS